MGRLGRDACRQELLELRRTAEATALVGHMILWGFALLKLPHLPERVPTHFGITGQADAWSSETTLSWLSTPMMAAGMALGILFLTQFLARRPDMVNVPGKGRLEGLPSRYRGPVSEAVREMMALLQVELIVIFLFVQQATWASAIGENAEAWTMGVMLTAVMSSPILLVVIMTRFPASIEKAWKRARAEGIQEP